MNRRDTIKSLVAASGGLIALPAWAHSWTVQDLPPPTIAFTSLAQETLAAVADTIIPPGNAIGALSVGVDKFLLKLIADCYEKEVQDNVSMQLQALDKTAMSLYDKAFKLCDQLQREEMLLKLSGSDDIREVDFFKLIKSETIRGFNTSQEVMVKYLHFKQVPGHYYGCVDVNA